VISLSSPINSCLLINFVILKTKSVDVSCTADVYMLLAVNNTHVILVMHCRASLLVIHLCKLIN